MKKKILTIAMLLTGLSFASTYNYIIKISDTNLFDNNHISNEPIMQNSTPQERTGIQSTGVVLASDSGIDWYGEVSAENLISGDDLADLLGLTNAVSFNQNAGWLHVGIDNKELYIAKKLFRRNLRSNHLTNINAKLGNRIVTINDQNYYIRVMYGFSVNRPTYQEVQYDHHHTHGSEWNRIMYRLTNENYSNTNNRKTSEGEFLNLAYYSEEDLDMALGSGFGSLTLETSSSSNYMTIRGGYGVSNQGTRLHPANDNTGWRPVLEKIN